jgi:hypothetical protein
MYIYIYIVAWLFKHCSLRGNCSINNGAVGRRQFANTLEKMKELLEMLFCMRSNLEAQRIIQIVPGLMRTALNSCALYIRPYWEVIWMLNIHFGILQFQTLQARNFGIIWCKLIRNFSTTVPHSLLSCGKWWRTGHWGPSEYLIVRCDRFWSPGLRSASSSIPHTESRWN